jgi:RNA polymerase sigma factor (sigma-70 family)
VHRLEQQPFDQRQAVNSPTAEDLELVAAVLRKDRKATSEFVARYADGLYRYVRSRLAPRHEQVDDLVQDVFLSAWQNLSQYRGAGSLQGWVMGIARHKVEDYYRERLRTPESIEDADLDPDQSSTSVPEIHRLLEQDQLRKNTQRVLAALPEQYRLLLLWRYWEKASTREMAFKTGKTEKAIERLLARARAEFRERWNHGQSS